MSKLTLDEAIKHCLEVAESNYELADKFDAWDEWEESDANNCRDCAADHRQLAEWLTELKQWRRVYGVCPSYEMCIPECKEGYNAQIAEYKRLLKAAVEDMNSNNICYDINACNVCTEKNCISCDTFHWRYTDEALELLNDEK